MDKILEIVPSKIIGNISALPLLVGVVVFSVLWSSVKIEQAAAPALFVCGVVALTEIIHARKEAKFIQACQEFHAVTANDGKTFLQFTEHVFGLRGLEKLQTKDISVDGLIFRHITTDKPSPISSILFFL